MARRTQAQLAETRESLIEAAERLFAEKGFANTQIAEIAERAGVGISSFYRQFGDKQELLGVIVDGLFEEVRRKLAEARRDIEQRTPLEQLLAIHRTYEIVFEVFAAHPDVAMTMLRSGYGTVVAVERLVWDSIDELVQDMVADLERAEANGLLRMERKRDFGDALIGMVIQLVHRMLVDGSPSAAEAAQFCTRMTVGAMLMFMPAEVLERITPLIAGFNWDGNAPPWPGIGSERETP